jgi:ATP phosphoribosyltransferase regulatory subunit
VTAGLPAGVSALLFGAARARRALERSLTERLDAQGWSEVLLPILDYFDPYRDLVAGAERELYRFVDREGELLALRGDFTPMLARLLAPRVRSLELPARLYYRGDVVRHRDAGPAGAREQCVVGVELLEAAPELEPPASDAPRVSAHDEEILSLLVELLGVAMGFDPLAANGAEKGLALVLSWAGVLDELLENGQGAPDAELALALSRRERAAVRGRRELSEILEEGLPADPDALGSRGSAAVAALIGLRDRMTERYPGVALRIDLAELTAARGSGDRPRPRSAASGLAGGGAKGARGYYDGVVFQAYSPATALPVASGGRYDTLFRELGAPLAAAGFQIALDLLLEIASARSSGPGVRP